MTPLPPTATVSQGIVVVIPSAACGVLSSPFSGRRYVRNPALLAHRTLDFPAQIICDRVEGTLECQVLE
ncbi:hypothetical protein FKP32DRAFT_1589776 [Trametes sanguinea]|nr:hypothetical protein FKP32DRAFT_1589776 [Trametes sanguinea]